MTGEEYQGYTNRETWTVHLILANTQELYQQATAIAANSSGWDGAEALRDWVRDMVLPETDEPRTDADLLRSDLLGYSISKVNWHEILAAFVPEEETWAATR